MTYNDLPTFRKRKRPILGMASHSTNDFYRAAEALMAEKRFSEAFDLYSDLALKGDSWAQLQIGWMHQQGVGVPRNKALALQWFRQAASLGSAQAAFYCGRAAAAERKWEEAIRAFRQAAEKDYGPALLWLGLIFVRGYGVAADEKKGVSYLERSAETGNYYARRELGIMMVKGKFGFGSIPSGLTLILKSAIMAATQYITGKHDDKLVG